MTDVKHVVYNRNPGPLEELVRGKWTAEGTAEEYAVGTAERNANGKIRPMMMVPDMEVQTCNPQWQ